MGAPRDARVVDRLLITKPGVYENLIVDGEGASGNLVKITADNVVVRNLEIRNGSGNGIGIFGENVLIEDCRIHHMLNGAFDEQADAHGISGRWGDTVIRNCEIFYCSGDCIQFDPGRKSSGRVVIEDCDLWTGPLPADAAMFSAGQRPGENAFDTKTTGDGDRCVVEIRNCHLRGFKQPAQISNVAALNLKERVDVEVRNCVFSDNEIAFRVRGPGKYRDGAHVAIEDCVVYDSKFGVRAEDGIENLRLSGLGFGQGVGERIRFVEGKPKAGFTNDGEHDAPAMEEVLAGGFSRP
ncbi:MAG: right-handed parallel beta-helix repeat-containing protein [Verrucomicrobiota bacterium]